MCCGNHLSQEAAQRLQRDGKPCPMCKDPKLNTVPNKHYKRKVNELTVRCPHKKSGCEWVGGVNEVKQHFQSCPKRPWQCQYCFFPSTYDIGVSEHIPNCTQYPIVCPNRCEVGTVPCCEVEAHLMVCLLEPVACEYAEVGCNVKVLRRDLARHMEEGQQQHLLSATLLNLRLTRENTEEKSKLIQERDETIAELQRQIAAKDQRIKQRDENIKEKDKTIADLQEQLKRMQDGLEAKVTNLQQHLTQQDGLLATITLRSAAGLQPYKFRTRRGFTLHEFTLTEFSQCQAKGGCAGDWYSEPFYSRPGEHKFKLNVCTNGDASVVSVIFKHLQDEHDDKLEWPITHTAHVQLLNQIGDHGHIEKTSTDSWNKGRRGCHGGCIASFIKLNELGLNADKNTQYLKNNCLHFRVYFKLDIGKYCIDWADVHGPLARMEDYEFESF